jgi:Na+/H+ antiporter NhaD/arsenite permease-like protein
MAYVSFAWSCPALIYLAVSTSVTHMAVSTAELLLLEFVPFIALLGSLFVLAGGLKLRINVRPTPLRNTFILGGFTLLSGALGTTGSAMLGIHPILLLNEARTHKTHTILFFIVLVCNVGGGLSSVGDPPLFLGFLKGIDFFWPTLNLWKPVLTLSIILLGLYFFVDLYFFKQEPSKVQGPPKRARLQIEGTSQIVLVGLVVTTLVSTPFVCQHIFCIHSPWLQEGLKVLFLSLITALSFKITPLSWRRKHHWTLHPLKEVAVVFSAIFITAHPLLSLLAQGKAGPLAPLVQALCDASGAPSANAYFWITGMLSAFLDNAPTYLIFFTAAGGDPTYLMNAGAHLLTAISLGAVLMGALTYIGNAPNLMVKDIAEKGYQVPMPSFTVYLLFSFGLLAPLFALVIPYFLN